jgi:DNA-binding beta-propeller fold protein YncE
MLQMIRRGRAGAVLGLLVVAGLAEAVAASADTWRLHARHTLGGPGGWDLLSVDAAARRVYITHGENLVVANVDDGKVLGEIGGLQRAHGVALAPSIGRGFVSSGGDGRVVAFDLKSLAPAGEVKAGQNPDAMLYEPVTGQIYAFNGRSKDATVIDPQTLAVKATFALPGKPELAVADGHGNVFVNLEDKNAIAAIDAHTNAITATWPLDGCEEPSGLAIDAVHARLFSVCSNKIMVVLDAVSGKRVASVVIGEEPDGAAFDPATGNVFSPNSDGTMTVVHEDDPTHFRVAATVATPPRSRTIALDEKSHRVVLPVAEFGALPQPSPQNPHPRPPIKADTFGFVVFGTH